MLLLHCAHLNRRWTLVLDLLVIPHGVAVAIHQGLGRMFAFGFGGVFVMTRLWGTNLSSLARKGVVASYIVGLVACCALLDRLDQWREVFRIPVLDYGVVLILSGLFVVVNGSLVPLGLVSSERGREQ